MLPRGTETTTVTERNGSLVKWLRRRPLTAESGVRLSTNQLSGSGTRDCIGALSLCGKLRKCLLFAGKYGRFTMLCIVCLREANAHLNCLLASVCGGKDGTIVKREEYEQKTERFLLPIVESMDPSWWMWNM